MAALRARVRSSPRVRVRARFGSGLVSGFRFRVRAMAALRATVRSIPRVRVRVRVKDRERVRARVRV